MGSNDITTREEKKSLPSQYCVLTGLYKNGYYYVTVCHKGAEDYSTTKNAAAMVRSTFAGRRPNLHELEHVGQDKT
jgi:hypothetical protein